jgi:O-antigen/teichoic acid export membrane protein
MSIAANFSYNLFFQIATVSVSFVSIPYATRLLGPEGMGIAAFTGGIAQYFVTVAMLGIPTYGIRETAYHRDDLLKRSQVFSEIITLQGMIGLVCAVAYAVYVLLFGGAYRSTLLLQGVAIIAAMIDVSWFHIGMERFRHNALIIGFSRILFLVVLILLLRRYPMVNVYVGSMTGTLLLGQVLLWWGVFRHVRFQPPPWQDAVRHLGGCFALFAVVLIGNFSLSTLKTLLGVRVSMEAVAAFEMAYRMTFFLLTFSVVIGTVLIPRIAHAMARQEHDLAYAYLRKSFQLVSGITLPVTAGIWVVAAVFVPWFFGDAFKFMVPVLQILSLTIVINAWSNVIATQYLVPAGKEMLYIRSLLVGNVIAVLLSLPMAHAYGAVGVAWARVLGELLVLGAHVVQTRRLLPMAGIVADAWKFAIAAVVMLTAVSIFLRTGTWHGFAGVAGSCGVGMAVYVAAVALLRPSAIVEVLRRMRSRETLA